MRRTAVELSIKPRIAKTTSSLYCQQGSLYQQLLAKQPQNIGHGLRQLGLP